MRLYLLGGWEQTNAPPVPPMPGAGASGEASHAGAWERCYDKLPLARKATQVETHRMRLSAAAL